MIRPRVPQEWKYRIPKLFFEAVLWEVVRAVGKAVKRTDALKEEILKSKIVLEWDDTQPRAQIAMIDHSWKLAWQVVNHRRRIYEIAKKNATARQKDRIKALEPMNRFWDRIKVRRVYSESRKFCNVLIQHSTPCSLPSSHTDKSKKGRSCKATPLSMRSASTT